MSQSAPVAVSQEGMLWHEQFSPGSFNLPCLVRRYEGLLDVAALDAALTELVRRHQPLRTTFDLSSGEARQVVADPGPCPLATVDLSGLTASDRDEHVARLLDDASHRPFDLATGPLFEPRLVRLGPDDHLLVVRLHHTVFDDWSVDVFRRELSALYRAGLTGAPSPLVEPPTSFVDHCRRQRARLAGGAGAAQRSWWRQELDGAPLSVQLPIGGEDAASGPAEPLRLDLPPALVAEVRAVARRLRATPFMTVLAAFSALVGRVTGQDDLVIATVVAARNETDVEGLIGCFTKKVPLRLRLHGAPCFAELVARTRASLLGALSHQDVPFDAAVQEGLGGPAAEHGVAPHVNVVFQGETPQQVKLDLPGLTTGAYAVPAASRRERHFSAGDGAAWGCGIYLGTFLIVSLLDTADGMAVVARGVFARPAGQRLLEEFVSLLGALVADPSEPVTLPPRPPDDGVVDLRGFRARRAPIEDALRRCPGVREVAVAVREVEGRDCLVAYIVADAGPPPTRAQLRRALWAELPGVVWPAQVVVVDRLDREALPVHPAAPGAGDDADPDPLAVTLSDRWGEIRGRPVRPDTSYWQDFSFLPVLAEARATGIDIDPASVVRCRTPAMLAAAVAAAYR